MTTPTAHAQNGFTLVEMLVALMIFALLAAAGVGILRASVDTQQAVEMRLSQLGRAGRVHALLTADLAQAVDRPTRAPSGTRPAFEGGPGGMSFVRAGWTNLDGAPRSNLQRVAWRSGNRALSRAAFDALDGSDEAAAVVPLARPIADATFRYRGADGSWSAAFRSDDRQPLPAAVEVTINARPGAPLVMVFALVQGAAAMPQPA